MGKGRARRMGRCRSAESRPVGGAAAHRRKAVTSILEAERDLLGSMLLDGALVTAIATRVGSDDFATLPHRHLFEALVRLRGQGEPITFVTAGRELESRGHLAEVGGSKGLVELASDVTTTAYAMHHAELVAQNGRHRKVAEILQRAPMVLE